MAATYETKEKREAYARRLFNRLWGLIAEEAPSREVFKGDDVWDAIDPADKEASAAWDDWMEGKIEREALDAVAQKYLAAWRAVLAEKRSGKGKLSKNVIDMFGGPDRPPEAPKKEKARKEKDPEPPDQPPVVDMFGGPDRPGPSLDKKNL